MYPEFRVVAVAWRPGDGFDDVEGRFFSRPMTDVCGVHHRVTLRVCQRTPPHEGWAHWFGPTSVTDPSLEWRPHDLHRRSGVVRLYDPLTVRVSWGGVEFRGYEVDW